jgi:cytochrome c-type biogenesis protein CcmH
MKKSNKHAGKAAPAAPESAPVAPPRPGKALLLATLAITVVVGIGGYAWTGNPAGTSAAAAAQPPAHADVNAAQFAEMVEKLAQKLKDKPDPTGYAMLGRSYMMLGQHEQSVTAYRQAIELKGDDASLMADMADAVAMRNGGRLDGEPMQWVDRALKLEPDNLKALSLRGAGAYQRGDFAAAAKSWDRVVAVGPPDSDLVAGAREGAEQARKEGQLAPSAPGAPVAAAGSGVVTGTVSLSAELKAKASPDDAVFIFARAAEGSRMPLAIVRTQVKDLPYSFTLNDAQAMAPEATLSKAGRVVVGARISKSGQAMPQPGDLEGLSAPIAVGASGVQVTISKALP